MQPEPFRTGRRKRRVRLVVEIVAIVAVLGAVAGVVLTRGDEKEDLGANPKLARELLAMERADQQARNAAIEAGVSAGVAESNEIAKVDRRNTERLQKIIDQFGWPTISLVGERASQSAWLIAQHADLFPSFQERALELMQKLPRDEVVAKNVAYLTDRVRVAKRQEQIYGTQFECRDGGLVPRTDIAPGDVDERRARVGLEPLEDYKQSFAEVYGECPKTATRTTPTPRPSASP